MYASKYSILMCQCQPVVVKEFRLCLQELRHSVLNIPHGVSQLSQKQSELFE